MFENIDDAVLYPQGIQPSDYTASISLLGNQDEYQFDIITAPGLTMEKNPGVVGELANMCTSRGDAIAIVDPSVYASTVAGTVSDGAAVDSSYAAAYWPWVQVRVPGTGKLHFVPASTIMPGVYAFNDRTAAEWFAPAGFNRGGLGMALQAERKLSPTDRDTLYLANVNPIATFPGRGPVAYVQPTKTAEFIILDFNITPTGASFE